MTSRRLSPSSAISSKILSYILYLPAPSPLLPAVPPPIPPTQSPHAAASHEVRHAPSVALPQEDQKTVSAQAVQGAVELALQEGQRKGRRLGAQNYCEGDVSALLDFVTHAEPLGNQDWAVVATKFADYTHEHGLPACDAEYVKAKLDKLENTQKKTGDPSFPP